MMRNRRIKNKQNINQEDISRLQDKPLPEEPKGFFAKFKVSIIDKPKKWVIRAFRLIIDSIKGKNKQTDDRTITKITATNKIQSTTPNITEQNNTEDSDEVYGELPGFKQASETSGDATYVNDEVIQNQNKGEEIYVNHQVIQSHEDGPLVTSIKQHMGYLADCLSSGKQQATRQASVETNQWFVELNKQSRQFTDDTSIKANDKFTNIKCPAHSSATKNNFYHANNINIGINKYIAAQGPYQKNNTTNDFIAMIAETNSPISISLVKDSEFEKITTTKNQNTKLPPQEIGETISIPAKIENGKTLYESTTIKMLNSIKDTDNNLQVDVLSINGKKHVRIYDLSWEDHSGGNPGRLAAISLFAKKLSNLPALKDRKDQPKIINCNAGVGRTGTAILIDHMITEIEEGNNLSEVQLGKDILHIRNSRPTLVQQGTQLETLRIFIKQGKEFIVAMKPKFNLE